jgi:hypothetical protein
MPSLVDFLVTRQEGDEAAWEFPVLGRLGDTRADWSEREYSAEISLLD